MEIKHFQCQVTSKRGEHDVLIRAFNKPQARRKLMTQFSNRHDAVVVKSVKLLVDNALPVS